MLRQLTDRVFFLPCDPATDRPCLGYLRGDRFSVMIDAGNSPAHAALLLEELRGAGLPRPRFVALTHWHWDHTFGLPGLDAAAAACSRTGRMLERMLGWKWDDASMAERLRAGEDILFCDEMIRREYPDRGKIALRPADLLYEDRLDLLPGGCSCRLLRVGGPHSDDCVTALIPEEGVLFLGDAYCEDMHHGEPHYPRAATERLISSLRALDFTVAVGGHCPPLSRADLFGYLEGVEKR